MFGSKDARIFTTVIIAKGEGSFKKRLHAETKGSLSFSLLHDILLSVAGTGCLRHPISRRSPDGHASASAWLTAPRK